MLCGLSSLAAKDLLFASSLPSGTPLSLSVFLMSGIVGRLDGALAQVAQRGCGSLHP